jgi:hypothetical protein
MYSDQGGLSLQGTQGPQQGVQQGAKPGVQGAQGTQQGAQQSTPQQGPQQGVQGTQGVLGIQKSYFKGDGKSLQLSTNYSIWGGQKGYVLVTYRVDTDRSGKRALYASEHIIGIEASRETKLLEGFDDIGFEYFEKGLVVGEPGTWVQQWTNDTATPSKIRLYLLSGSKERRMVLPIRASAQAAAGG